MREQLADFRDGVMTKPAPITSNHDLIPLFEQDIRARLGQLSADGQLAAPRGYRATWTVAGSRFRGKDT
jgi:hypothetical protein